jgi:hypothetical protein
MRRLGARLTSLLMGFAILALSNSVAVAQCSMCKAVLTSTKDANFIRGYNIGVLVLLLPPVTIFCSIFVMLKRHRGESDDRTSIDKD